MSAVVSEADRKAAHAVACSVDVCGVGGIDTVACAEIAQAIADAREAGEAKGRDDGLRFARFLVEEEIRVATTSRKKGMRVRELWYWDGRQETAQRVLTMVTGEQGRSIATRRGGAR